MCFREFRGETPVSESFASLSADDELASEKLKKSGKVAVGLATAPASFPEGYNFNGQFADSDYDFKGLEFRGVFDFDLLTEDYPGFTIPRAPEGEECFSSSEPKKSADQSVHDFFPYIEDKTEDGEATRNLSQIEVLVLSASNTYFLPFFQSTSTGVYKMIVILNLL